MKVVWLILLALLVGGLGLAQTTRPAEDAGVAVYVGGEMVKGYHPTPALVTRETKIEKPKFPAIDIHCHWSIDRDATELLAAMDALGETKAVNLSGGYGKALDQMLEKFHKPSPDRLLIFCNVDWKQVGGADFAKSVEAYLRDARSKGVSGLKVFKDLGLTAKDTDGKRIAIDDPRLDVVWRTCAELKMPVLIHAADPIAFFQPVDEHNERWMQLKRHPDWSFYGHGFASYEQVIAEHNRMIARNRDTVFISAHLANSGEDLARLSEWLLSTPNAYVDISGRVSEIGRQPYSARRFLMEHQDRVMFGTDRYPGRSDQRRNSIYYRFLETDDEYFDYYDHQFPPEGEWKIYGVKLSDEVLQKIYNGNALRALTGQMPLR